MFYIFLPGNFIFKLLSQKRKERRKGVKRIAISIAVLLTISVLLLVPLARADGTAESFIVYTDKTDYLAGEPINIYVKAQAIDPGQNITVTDVVVYDPSYSIVAEWHSLSIVLTSTTTPELVGTLTATIEGNYTVQAEATGCPFILRAIFWFFLRWLHSPTNTVPEVPFGTIAAAAALLGATTLYLTRKRYRIKK